MSRILLIDDNADNLRASASLLRAWGHEVRLALDGRDALEVARAWRPDVALLDIGLPGMDGFEVAAAFRQDPSLGSCRVIAISALRRDEDEEQLTRVGVYQFLRKPLDVSFLRSLLGSTSGPLSPRT